MARLYSTNFYSRPETGFAPSAAPYGASGTLAAFRDVGLSGLKQSLPYKQTDWRGRQRMEQMVAMGLPFNTDPSRVRAEPALTSAMGGRPIYSTSMPQPWGTWGGFGQNEEDRPVKLPEPIGIEPATTSPAQPRKSELGMSGEPIAFTPFGERVRQESQPQPRAGSPFPAGTVGSLTGFGGVPRFPYANY